jgi:hypothetical protein
MIVKAMLKPMTKLREWRNTGICLFLSPGSSISGPHRLAKYTGTKGSTQGDKKDNSPAPKAIQSGIFSM